MNPKQKANLWTIVAGACLAAACASQPPAESAQAPAVAQAQPAPVVIPAAPKPAPIIAKAPEAKPAAPRSAANPLDDPKSILAKRSVYYDYDQDTVKAEYRPMVEAHAQYLRANPGASVRIEGNCDERGGREYNLALGQRRAESMAKLMVLLGARESQMETVSWGEEKAKAIGHNETAWSQNRRGDIVYVRAR